MKLFLALFLCGVVACCLAHPRCSDQELLKCSVKGRAPGSYMNPETEEEMEEFCRVIDCIVGYYDRCPSKGYDDMLKVHKVIISTVCDKTNPLRRKYLENAKCLNNAVKEIIPKCGTPVDQDLDHETRCKELAAAYECAKEQITSTCNKDSTDVFIHVYPQLDFYGC